MFRLRESAHVNAPIDRCFLLSTSVDVVRQTLGLKPVEGKTSGLIGLGDRLVWRGWKFGLPAVHETLITGYERPRFFQDTMGAGRFRFFQHDHFFEEIAGHTVLRDVVRFSMPLGVVGKWVGSTFVVPHVMRLMQRRFELLKRLAEGEGGERFLPQIGVATGQAEGISAD